MHKLLGLRGHPLHVEWYLLLGCLLLESGRLALHLGNPSWLLVLSEWATRSLEHTELRVTTVRLHHVQEWAMVAAAHLACLNQFT